VTEPRPLVRNAADPQQVRLGGRKERRRADALTSSLKAVMSTAEGRLVMWTLLEKAGLYRSVWDPHAPDLHARTHYLAGRQDFGHELLGLLTEDLESYLTMEAEARRRQARDEREAAAYQVDRPIEGDESNA
jgi:hypothetical protein